MWIKNKLLFGLFILFCAASFAKNIVNKSDVEVIVHDYLIAHPEILIKMSTALQEKLLEAKKDNIVNVCKKNLNYILNTKNSSVVGNSDSRVGIVEFFDYQCVHCKNMNSEVAELLKHNPNIKIIYKVLPIMGDRSILEAKIALAANKQGNFVKVSDKLFKMSRNDRVIPLMQADNKIKLNYDILKKDIFSKNIASEIDSNVEFSKKIDIDGVPAFLIFNLNKMKFDFISGYVSWREMQKILNRVSR